MPEPLKNLDDQSKQFQHYVPAFYLKAWATNVKGRSGQVWIYERGKAPFVGSIRKSAGKINAYSIRKFGATDVKEVEGYLSAKESIHAPVIRKIKAQEHLSANDRFLFAEFLGIMFRRVSFMMRKAEVFGRSQLPRIVGELGSIADQIACEEKKRIAQQNLERVKDEATLALQTIGPNLIVGSKTQVPNFILGMDWGFFQEKNETVVTSDNPFVFDESFGIAHPANGHIIFPISPSMWFQAFNWPLFGSKYYDMPAAIVSSVNLRTIVCAYRQVYANRYDPTIEELVNGYLGAALPKVD